MFVLRFGDRYVGDCDYDCGDRVLWMTKGIITEDEAKQLFTVFYEGCSTFLPVFDANVDTYEAVRGRSAFAFDSICMVAARCRDGNCKSFFCHLFCGMMELTGWRSEPYLSIDIARSPEYIVFDALLACFEKGGCSGYDSCFWVVG